MAINSYRTYTGDGVTTQWDFTFPKLDNSHVIALVDSVETAYTWVTEGRIEITPAVATGLAILIKRSTPDSERLADFSDGNTISAEDIEVATTQNFFLVQEGLDNDNLVFESDVNFAAIAEDLAGPRHLEVVSADFSTNAYVSVVGADLAGANGITITATNITNVGIVADNIDAIIEAPNAVQDIEDARDQVLDAVELTENVSWAGSRILEDGTRLSLAGQDADDQVTWYVTSLGEMYQGNGQEIEKVLTQNELDVKIEDAAAVKVVNNIVDADGTRWAVAFLAGTQVISGIAAVGSSLELRVPSAAGPIPVSTGGSSYEPTYTQDPTTLASTRTDAAYTLVVIKEGQSNEDAVNPDGADPINYTARPVDIPTGYVLMPSVGTRPEGSRFTTLVDMYEDAAKANTRESSLSSLCYTLHRQIFDTFGIRVRIIGYVAAQTAQDIEELGRGSTYAANSRAALADIGTICKGNGWKPEVVRTMTQGEADSGLDYGTYFGRKETEHRQDQDDIKRILGTSEEVLLFNFQPYAGNTRDVVNANWVGIEPPLAIADLPSRNPAFRCSGPIFGLGHSSDGLHLSCDGQVHKGVLEANAIYKELFGTGWVDWEHTGTIWRSNQQVELTLSAPTADLVLGDATVDMTGNPSVSGFIAHDRNQNEVAISTVSIVADDRGVSNIVRIDFTNPVARDTFIEMGRRKNDAATDGGPTQGGRHELRTTATLTCPITAATLYERAPCMSFSVGAPNVDAANSSVIVGIYDWNDTGTASSPVSLTAGTPAKMTNNGLGSFTNLTYGIPGVTPFDTSTSEFDFTDLALGDSVDIRVDITVTTTSANEIVDIDFSLGEGASPYTIPIMSREFRYAGPHRIVAWSSIYMGDTTTRDNPATITVTGDNTGSTVVNNGWYVRVLPRTV